MLVRLIIQSQFYVSKS